MASTADGVEGMAVTDAAILAIKEMIMSGELGPGDRLPPEKQLSEHLGVSRNSLREAVKALVMIRILDVRQGDGTYVTSLAPDLLLEVLGFVVDLSRDHSMLDALAVRRMLEPEATALASTRIGEEQLDELEQLMADLAASSGVEELVEADLVFHRGINGACGNPYLSSLLEGLASATVRARVWRGYTQADSIIRTIDEHREILRALRLRSPRLARACATAHVVGVELWLAKTVAEEPDRDGSGDGNGGSTG